MAASECTNSELLLCRSSSSVTALVCPAQEVDDNDWFRVMKVFQALDLECERVLVWVTLIFAAAGAGAFCDAASELVMDVEHIHCLVDSAVVKHEAAIELLEHASPMDASCWSTGAMGLLVVVFVVASFVLHVCCKDVLASGFDGGPGLVSTERAQDVCFLVSSLLNFERAYLFPDLLAYVCFASLSSFGVVFAFLYVSSK